MNKERSNNRLKTKEINIMPNEFISLFLVCFLGLLSTSLSDPDPAVKLFYDFMSLKEHSAYLFHF